MMILEADLPVLPGEGVDNLLLGALLSAYLQSLIFTDGHTSANENNITINRPLRTKISASAGARIIDRCNSNFTIVHWSQSLENFTRRE